MLAGQEKRDWEFVSYRAKKQMALWPRLVRGEAEGLDLSGVDPEILACCVEGKNFRSEGHVSPVDGTGRIKSPMEEMWLLYIGVQSISEEDEARGKDKPESKTKAKSKPKKSKDRDDEAIEPIRARRVVGHQIIDKDSNPTDQWSYDSVQWINDKTGKPTGGINAYGGIHFHDDGYLDFSAWLYARDQARKDLLWFNVAVLGNTKVNRATHQIVCNQFVQKNFDGVYRRGYSLDVVQASIGRQNRIPVQWNPVIKNYEPILEEASIPENLESMMILLYPRGFFKSTIGRADAVQWLLNCPDISMMIMTAARDLAAQFVLDIKRQFYLAKGADPKALHLLFPEYVLRGVDGTSAEDLICPARRRERIYPTLWADSIDSTLSGWHCDLLKFDDAVSNTNCLTDTTREKLRGSIDNTLNLCDPWGKVDMLGTRYFPDDYYGTRFDKYIEEPETAGLKFFVGAAWYVKSEFIHIERKSLRDLMEHMVILTFPEHASFKSLRGKLVNNEQEFRCQQLNQPVWGAGKVDLPLALLQAHMMLPTEAKALKGDVLIMGDMAKEAKKNSDYSAFVAVKIFQRIDQATNTPIGPVSVVVLEVVYGKWSQSETANSLAELNKRWLPWRIQIENTGGLESFMTYAIPDAFKKTNLPWHHIYWAAVEQGFDAKRNRIKGLEILLKAERLWFSMGPWNDETFSQLSQYTGAKSTRSRKDDIPDAMAFISKYLPSSTPKTPEEQEQEANQAEKEMMAKFLAAQHEAYFGNSNPNFAPQQIEESPISSPYDDIKKKFLGR